MLANRDKVLDAIILSEGPEVNYNDPGGASKYGVTVVSLGDYWDSKATVADAEALTEKDARDFYVNHFMPMIRFDELPSGVDYRLMDILTNSGPSGAIWLLELVLRRWPLTGKLTDDLFAEIKALDARALIMALSAAWIADKHARKDQHTGWPASGHGWSNRNIRVTHDALAMVEA